MNPRQTTDDKTSDTGPVAACAWTLALLAALSATVALVAYGPKVGGINTTLTTLLLVTGGMVSAALAVKSVSSIVSFSRCIKAHRETRLSQSGWQDHRRHYQVRACAWTLLSVASIAVVFTYGTESGLPATGFTILALPASFAIMMAGNRWDIYAYCSHQANRRRCAYSTDKTMWWKFGLSAAIIFVTVIPISLGIATSNTPAISASVIIGYILLIATFGSTFGEAFYPAGPKTVDTTLPSTA